MLQTDNYPAIPLWINGRAYLTMTPGFADVTDMATGKVVRRIPLCGASEVAHAVAAATGAVPDWVASGLACRAEALGRLGEALTAYAPHFAQLLAAESGMSETLAGSEVCAASEALRQPPTGPYAGVVAACADKHIPFSCHVRLLAAALNAGAAVVVRTPPEMPSALFALAELSGRCAFPAGVLNVIHGGEATAQALRAAVPDGFIQA